MPKSSSAKWQPTCRSFTDQRLGLGKIVDGGRFRDFETHILRRDRMKTQQTQDETDQAALVQAET